MHPKLLDYKLAAGLLGIKEGTLASMVHRRQIPHLRMGPRLVRFDYDVLIEWARERRVEVAK